VLTGCSAVKVKLGWRVDLTKTPVSSIEVSLPKGPAIAPGQKSPLVVKVTQPDGKVLLTEGQGGGKVQWKDLHVTATVVTANQKGVISLAKDPRVSDGKVGHVTVTVPSHPDIHAAELDIPFRYNVAFVSDFSGSRGSDGMNGADGSDGISGTPCSTDPNNPSPGGDGTNGTDGSNGQDGSPGGNAPPVDVRITLQPANPLSPDHALLQLSVSAQGKQRLYLVDPQGGSLKVVADGGPGGSGGRGGRGGRGGSGGIGTPNGRDGMKHLSPPFGNPGTFAYLRPGLPRCLVQKPPRHELQIRFSSSKQIRLQSSVALFVGPKRIGNCRQVIHQGNGIAIFGQVNRS